MDMDEETASLPLYEGGEIIHTALSHGGAEAAAGTCRAGTMYGELFVYGKGQSAARIPTPLATGSLCMFC